MALRVIMLRKKLTAKQAELDALREAAAGFAQREAELEAAINEAATDEEREAVEAEVSAFEADQSANDEAVSTAEAEISELETQINEAEQRARQARDAAHGAAGETKTRKDGCPMSTPETRTKFFNMTVAQRDAFFAREDVSGFLARLRDFGAQQRGVSGAELGIPIVILDLLRDNMERYSKLVSFVRLRQVKGKARQNVVGKIPEGVWTEAVNVTLNELALAFTQVEVDGFKIGGYIAIDNAYLADDSNLQLGATIIDALGQAIGYGLDKAIVYGTGAKMPVGFMTRLAASSQPAWWGDNQGDFTDLHEANIKKLDIDSKTGAEFFASLTTALGIAKPNYSNGQAIWLMSRATHMHLLSKALAFDAAASLVAGINDTMPVVGGRIIELEFIPDNEIVGGFMDLYLLVEREGAAIGSSDIPLYLQDKTVYKATARYDGKPIIGEGFVAVSFDNTAVTTAATFAPDSANSIGSLTVASVAGTASGDSKITVTGAGSGALKYKVASDAVDVQPGTKIGSGWKDLTNGGDVTAATGKTITVVEVNESSNAVRVGSTTVTAKT